MLKINMEKKTKAIKIGDNENLSMDVKTEQVTQYKNLRANIERNGTQNMKLMKTYNLRQNYIML